MIGFELGERTGDELIRFVRAVGQHRYVASRLILIHAFAIDAAADPSIEEANAWARRTIGAGGAIDLASKDDRLWRKASEAELGAVLRAFWGEGHREAAKRLRVALEGIGVKPDETALPFDESSEEEVFPVLVDAGWELLPLAQLDFERHKGAIQAFSDFEVAKFEEENAIPPLVTMHELPTLGPIELLAALDDDERARAPFVLWQQGNETYLDYVLRGISKVSKVELPAEEDEDA